MSVIAPERTWRVKLYTLSAAGDWEEIGTAYTHFEGRQFSCVSEGDTRVLLSYTVDSEVYRRQGRTIILWMTPDSQNFALSFQQPDGAQNTLEHFCRLQDRDLADIEDEETDKEEAPQIPDVSTLLGLNEAASKFSALRFQGKQHLAEAAVRSGLLQRLETVFTEAEEQKDEEKLAALFTIYKELVHCCNSQLIEELLSDAHCQTMFGALECKRQTDDPAIKGKNMHFREFLQSVTFRNVLRTTDSEFLSLLHQNYRIQYLKDTALARCMDESCVGFLTTYQLSLANETIAYFTRAADLKKALVERLKDMDVEGFELLGEMNGMVKAVAAYTRIEFYEFLYSEGIVAFATHALSHHFPPSENSRIRVLLSDLIVSLLTSLPARAKDLFTLEEQKEETAELVKAVADALLSAKEISAVMQLAELMHVVIDPPGDKRESELSDYFFDTIFPSLITPLSQQSVPDEETRILLCEILSLLTHCIQAQYPKVRFLLLSSDVLATVFRLLELSDKPLAIAALKLLRTVMEKNDSVIIKHVITHNLLQKVWSLLLANGPRETMVFSSVLSFIAALEGCDNPQLTDHIVVKHLPQFHNSPLYSLFEKIELKHQPRADAYALWNPREISAKEDEAYFEDDSDEDTSTLKRKREDSNDEFEKKAKLEAAED